ncbi:MAG: CcmD family protein [Bacteroidota bacterium]
MNNSLKKTLLFTGLQVLSASAFAQETTEKVEMADSLYQSGKIYVVVTVLAILFVGITGYLISLDRKIGKLEKEINKK